MLWAVHSQVSKEPVAIKHRFTTLQLSDIATAFQIPVVIWQSFAQHRSKYIIPMIHQKPLRISHGELQFTNMIVSYSSIHWIMLLLRDQ